MYNGIPYQREQLDPDELETVTMQKILETTSFYQRAVYLVSYSDTEQQKHMLSHLKVSLQKYTFPLYSHKTFSFQQELCERVLFPLLMSAHHTEKPKEFKHCMQHLIWWLCQSYWSAQC